MKYTATLTLLSASLAAVEAMPQAPPSLKGADSNKVPNQHQCAFVYGDPHVFSWDQKAVDCRMGEGDYLYAKSETTPFEIQVRHVSPPWKASKANFEKEGWYIGTGGQAVVINTGVHGEPVIEINAETPGAKSGGHCKMNYLFDGIKTDLPADTTIDGVQFERRESWEKSLWSNHWYTHHYRNFYFPSGVFVQVTKKYWEHYGCFMNVRICLPDEIKNQPLYGLLGNANGNPNDDFRDLEGKVVKPTPSWGSRDTWCNKNWCIADKESNMFKEPKKVQKDQHVQTCTGFSADPLDEAVKNASPLLKQMCDDDTTCIFDTLASGEVETGLRTLIEKVDKDKTPKETDPQPEDQHEEDFCTTPEGEEIDCDPFEFEFQCESMEGYDFGFEMNGCEPITDGLFHDLSVTDENPTCNVGGYNVGTYSMSCSQDGEEVTLTPMVDGAVKIEGEDTGMLYTGFEAGKTYTLTTGPGTKKQKIKNIEFCFKCPTSIVNHEVVTCAADVTTCGDGTQVKRDPAKDCHFADCPVAFKAPPPDSPSPEDKKTNRAFSKGDPHFKTFGGELYDFHGECDLVLLHNPDFAEGLGMDIHIRTKIESFWSSIESSVIALGKDTMEIRADPSQDEWIWFNGKAPAAEDQEDGVWSKHQVGEYLVRYRESKGSRGTTREANLYLVGSKEMLLFKTFKGFLRIDVNWEGSENYYNSVGLLGAHAHQGKRLGRDGVFIEDTDAFGQEWQVRPDVDGKLFHSYEGAIVGDKCKMPPAYHPGDELTTTALRGRRLGASAVNEDAAEKACNHLVDPEEKKACVFDVVATQDLNMASTW